MIPWMPLGKPLSIPRHAKIETRREVRWNALVLEDHACCYCLVRP